MISNKNIIASNKLYEKWKNLSEEKMREKFKWARGSKQAKEVRRLENVFYEKVNAVSTVAMEAKKKKESKIIKTIQNVEDCKAHGGPLTAKYIEKIDKLTDEQIMLEPKYLKKTIAPNI